MDRYPQNYQTTPLGSAQYQYPPPQQSQPQQGQRQQNPEAFLCEAFPNVDRTTVGAILASTRGEVDPAYNALVAISGPSRPSLASGQSAPILPPRPSSSASSQPPMYGTASPTPAANQSYYPSHAPPMTNSSYLTPQQSAPAYLSPSASYSSQPQTGSVTPLYPPASPNLAPAHDPPPQYQHHAESYSAPSVTLDMSKMSLNDSRTNKNRKQAHYATCDGCNADPITTNRWQCVVCDNYDICDECRESGIHNHHRFRQMRELMEIHENIYCDGCGKDGKILEGVRYECKKHSDEDWCERCVETGKACGGPYNEIKQTDFARQIELAGESPMPSHWVPYLKPVESTFTMEADWVKDTVEGWYSALETVKLYHRPATPRKNTTGNPAYQIDMKQLRGHVVSDHHYSQVIQNQNGDKLYSYERENDRKTNKIKSEKFGLLKGRVSTPVWKRGPNSDSLSFEDPKTGVQYRWMTAQPISGLNGQRYEFNRYGLFRRSGGKEAIVADWAWLNGHHELMESEMKIRDAEIDPAMVLASFFILHKRESEIYGDERAREPDNFAKTEDQARLTVYGRMWHWRVSDYQQAATVAAGSGSGMSNSEKLKMAGNAAKLAHSGYQLFNAIAAANGGGGA